MLDAGNDLAPVRFETLPTASGHAWGRATLNAPANLNALSLAMIDRLDPQLAAWIADPQIVGVVLDAAGDKAFCAGGDVVAPLPARSGPPGPGQVPPDAAAFFEREYRLDYRHPHLSQAIDVLGPRDRHGWRDRLAGGRLAPGGHAASTRLAMPEINIGLYPDVGGSWILRRACRDASVFSWH